MPGKSTSGFRVRTAGAADGRRRLETGLPAFGHLNNQTIAVVHGKGIDIQIGVEVLESIPDPRFAYFNNKIHTLMLRKHIVTKLRSASGLASKDAVVSQSELQNKK